MSLSNIQNQGGPIGTSGLSKTQKTTKRVADIILSNSHAAYTGPDSIGIIFFTDEKTKESASDTTTLPRAKPLNLNNFTTPLIGELVNIIQSTSDDYYPDLGGNPSFTSNYYTPTINVYNNAGSNAVPLDNTKVKGNKKSKTDQSEPTFEFQKEFSSVGSRSVVEKMCNNYLVSYGYPSGRNDPNAPTYTLEPGSNGGFILKLDDSKENKVKLGSYYRENANQSNLNPTEGGTVNQGKNGQRISFSANNKAHVGDLLEQNRAMVLSLGDGEIENINDDDGTIHLATNQKVNIKTASNLIASLHSEYKPYVEPLKQIEKQPVIAIPTTNPTPELLVVDHFLNLEKLTVTETVVTTIPSASVDPFYDPVFAALDDAIDEGILSEITPEEFELDVEYIPLLSENTPFSELTFIEGEDPSPQINPNRFGAYYPGPSPSHPHPSTKFSPLFNEFGFNVRKITKKKDIEAYIISGDLVIVGDSNLNSGKYSSKMESAIKLDGKYYLHKACAPAFNAWQQEMDENGIKYRLTSALRYGKETGGGPHGLGLAVDFGNLHAELADYGVKVGSTNPEANQQLRINSQNYKDIANIGAKHGWFNPWRLADGGGTIDEVWHFEYWAEPLA